MMHPLERCLLEGQGRPQPGLCTVAFSGGADSTALLLGLLALRETLQIDLRAVHIHHGIRGEEADRDAAFCEALCRRLDIPFQCIYADVPAFAAEHRYSLETAARLLRYEALFRAAPEGEIATAHHAGDNAETLLFHLMRGSGLRGLCGIPARNGRIIRPLLDADKSVILSYLREKQQSYMEDSTNAEAESSRNRIRHSLLPLMVQENPAVIAHLSRTAALLREDEALLTQLAEEAFSAHYDRDSGGLRGLQEVPQPLRMRIYMRMLADLPGNRIDPNFQLLHQIDRLLQTGGKLDISGRRYAAAERGMLYFTAEELQTPLCEKMPLQIGENRLFPQRICYAELINSPQKDDSGALSRKIHQSDTKSTLDFDKIIGEPYFRVLRRQDRIRLPGRAFDSDLRKSVQQLFPAPERKTVYALFDAEGCIFCERVGVAARVKPDADTQRRLSVYAFYVE